MADEVRLIDANSVCRSIVESIRYTEEWIREAREQQDTVGLQYASNTYSSLISMLERIQNEPTVEAEPDNGWISVKDRLPENETEVLIYCPEFVCKIKLAMWIEDGFYVDKEDLIVKAAPNGYCTHWRLLPELPKGE